MDTGTYKLVVIGFDMVPREIGNYTMFEIQDFVKYAKPESSSQRKTHLSILDEIEAKSYRRAGASSGHICLLRE